MTKILSNDITTIKSIIYSSQPLLTYSGRKFVYIDDKGQKQKYTLNQAILTLKELEKIQPIEVIPLKAMLLSKYKESEKLSFNSSFQKICVRISQFIGNYLFKYSHGKIDREAFLVTNSEKFSSVVPTQNFHVPNIYFDLVPRDVTGIVRNYVNHSNLYELVKEFEDLMSCFDKLVASYKKNFFINSVYLEKYDNLKLDLKKFAHHVFYSLFNIRDVHCIDGTPDFDDLTKFAQAFKTSGKPFLLYTYSEFNVECRELIFLENGIEKPVVVSVSFYFDKEKGAFSIQFPRYVDGLDNQYKYQVTFYPNRFEDSFPVAAFSKFSQDFYYELKNLIESGKQVHADFIANYE